MQRACFFCLDFFIVNRNIFVYQNVQLCVCVGIANRSALFINISDFWQSRRLFMRATRPAHDEQWATGVKR